MHLITLLFVYTMQSAFGQDLFQFNMPNVFHAAEKTHFHPESQWIPVRKAKKIPEENAEKIPDINGPEMKSDKVSNILKEYLVKLYQKKYEIGRNEEKTHESKFIDTSSLFNIKNSIKSKKKNFLSLFQIIKFDNSECLASGGSMGDYMGVCYHQSQCEDMGGTAMGDCADGYGVCCVFKQSCGDSSDQECTYFESPNYPDYDPPTSPVLPPSPVTMPPFPPSPTPDPRWQYVIPPPRTKYRVKRQTSALICTLSISKSDDRVEQMRIDFLDLDLAAPTNGTCVNERLVISGQNDNSVIPVICGYNTGQHVYVDVSTSDGPLEISVLSNQLIPKRFKIRICQISEPTCRRANCLQYYEGVTGTISSFNYDQAALFNRSRPGYLNNLNYAICIQREDGYCSITYSNMDSGLEYPFELRNVNAVGQSTIPPGQAGSEMFNCPDDYLIINGVRLCGERINDGSMIPDFTRNAPITDTGTGPITVQVRTNGAVNGRGFKLFYMQNQC